MASERLGVGLYNAVEQIEKCLIVVMAIGVQVGLIKLVANPVTASPFGVDARRVKFYLASQNLIAGLQGAELARIKVRKQPVRGGHAAHCIDEVFDGLPDFFALAECMRKISLGELLELALQRHEALQSTNPFGPRISDHRTPA